jgi:putative membrane protein
MKHIRVAAAMALILLATSPAVSKSVEPKPANDAAPVMVVDTPTFVKMATGSDQFEIKSSEMAKEKAGDAGLKAIADMIIADHTKATEKLEATLDSKDQPFEPAPPSPKQQKMLEQLQAASRPDFDILYLDMQAQAHMEAIALFRTYAGSGDNQAVVGFAKETLPRLETHLAHVKEHITAH